MSFQFTCPACGAILTVPDTASGKTGPCPKCCAQITAPANSAPSNAHLRSCPSCGKGVSLRAAACPHCGDPLTCHAVSPPQAQRAPTGHVEHDLLCPKCGSTQVQKVSAVVQAGTWSADTVGGQVTTGSTSGGVTVSGFSSFGAVSAGATDLARMLTAPAKPEVVTPTMFYVVLAVGIGGMSALGGAVIAVQEHPNILSQIIWGGVLAAVTLVAWIVHRYIAVRKQIPDWEASMRKWNILWHCSRCGHVYNPQTGQAVPAQNMKSLLG